MAALYLCLSSQHWVEFLRNFPCPPGQLHHKRIETITVISRTNRRRLDPTTRDDYRLIRSLLLCCWLLTDHFTEGQPAHGAISWTMHPCAWLLQQALVTTTTIRPLTCLIDHNHRSVCVQNTRLNAHYRQFPRNNWPPSSAGVTHWVLPLITIHQLRLVPT